MRALPKSGVVGLLPSRRSAGGAEERMRRRASLGKPLVAAVRRSIQEDAGGARSSDRGGAGDRWGAGCRAEAAVLLPLLGATPAPRE